jgi:hypothetical protein
VTGGFVLLVLYWLLGDKPQSQAVAEKEQNVLAENPTA